MVLIMALIVLLSIIPAASGLPDEAAGRVVSVVNGDSLGVEMLISDPRANHIDSIKLADIDVPSTVTAAGKAAKAYAASLLKNRMVYLDIEDNISRSRNQWSQLICLVYLMDEGYHPLWPPVNRIMVDAGHASLNDDINNEFNASDWWGEPSSSLAGVKGDLLLAMREGESSLSRPGPATASSADASAPGDPREVSILKKDSRSGAMSIGYRK